MSPALLSLIMGLVTSAPQLIPEFIKLYGDIAHGPGGGEKVAKAFTDVAAILTGAASTVATTTKTGA